MFNAHTTELPPDLRSHRPVGHRRHGAAPRSRLERPSAQQVSRQVQAPAASLLAPRGRSKPTVHRRVDQRAREGRAATCCTAPVPVNKKCLLCAVPPQVPPTAPGLATAVPTYGGEMRARRTRWPWEQDRSEATGTPGRLSARRCPVRGPCLAGTVGTAAELSAPPSPSVSNWIPPASSGAGMESGCR